MIENAVTAAAFLLSLVAFTYNVIQSEKANNLAKKLKSEKVMHEFFVRFVVEKLEAYIGLALRIDELAQNSIDDIKANGIGSYSLESSRMTDEFYKSHGIILNLVSSALPKALMDKVEDYVDETKLALKSSGSIPGMLTEARWKYVGQIRKVLNEYIKKSS